eukprot:12243035-Alexandrium_andersonii.AAC.1
MQNCLRRSKLELRGPKSGLKVCLVGELHKSKLRPREARERGESRMGLASNFRSARTSWR